MIRCGLFCSTFWAYLKTPPSMSGKAPKFAHCAQMSDMKGKGKKLPFLPLNLARTRFFLDVLVWRWANAPLFSFSLLFSSLTTTQDSPLWA
ncbi:hypothetical protein AVEN_211454-1 [Araneus ventricosus]|uniref:Uncharacterized protein n=1 Tax=Araneus ventricosus TaxID=182803 RepID=A0A4Y2J116_ARAVE|nr:hypothetical protein AVEN_211454-1 [Araneus ventricosus]